MVLALHTTEMNLTYFIFNFVKLKQKVAVVIVVATTAVPRDYSQFYIQGSFMARIMGIYSVH